MAESTFARLVVAAGIAGADRPAPDLRFVGDGDPPSAFAVGDFAAASVGTAAAAVAALIEATHDVRPAVEVDRRLATAWFVGALRPDGWSLPPAWDALAGDYRCRDGWIRLHTNAPHHRAAALAVLGAAGDRAAVVRAVEAWDGAALETAIVEHGGCAAQMRSLDAWRAHPQGRAIAAEPLVGIEIHAAAGMSSRPPGPADRPLAGVRVLDLTRVLAGPVATRALAGFGAEVLRLDPPGWDEPGVVPEVTLGKRCARLDLRTDAGRQRFLALLAGADVFVHGLRPGALDGLGLDRVTRRAVAPGAVEVGLDAYGFTGPWAARRGFDSLVQMSAGIADAGLRWRHGERAGCAIDDLAPVPLPMQALDHAAGWLAAAAAVDGLRRRRQDGRPTTVRLSLARTALALGEPAPTGERRFPPEAASDLDPTLESTPWGPARRLLPPLRIAGTPMRWDLPAAALGTSPASWTGQ